MDPETLAAPGSLATALIPAAMERRLPSERPPVPNPAEVLASVMDFPGSVALAELLDALLAEPARPSDRACGRADALLREVQLRLDSIEPQVLKPLLGRRAPELPSAPALLALLEQLGLTCAGSRAPGGATSDGAPAPSTPSTERLAERLAEELGAPLHGALGLSLRQAQAHIATLRAELGPELRALGPRAAQLERLDATLTRSMQASVGQLLDRMEHAAQLTFARACAHAVANLPVQVGAAELAAWCASDGWLARYHERCVRMAKALFDHLRRSLEGLLRAAILSEES
jgi:hypothetical protein